MLIELSIDIGENGGRISSELEGFDNQGTKDT